MNYPKRCSFMLCVLAYACAFSGGLLAAPASEILVSDKQLRTMGITLMPLTASSESGKALYPAKVVLPVGSEFVVSAPVNGMISQVLVEPGQAVKRGQLLLRISSPELAKLQLDLLQAANRSRLAGRTAAREDRLLKEGIISERRQQEAASARIDAAATLSQARAALAFTGMSSPSIERIIRTNKLEDSLTLVAHTTGVVMSVSARPGQRVESSSPLLSVAALGDLWLDIQLPSAQANSISLQAKVTIPGRDVQAQIASIGSVVGSAQTVTVRARVLSKASDLRAGEFIQVALPVSQEAGSWSLPLAALARQGESAYVFVRTAKGFTVRPVKIIASAGQKIRAQGELKAGDQVAVSSVVTLKAAWLGESGGE